MAEVKKKKQNTKTTSSNSTTKNITNKPRPLNQREKKFCREYLKSGNASQACIKAGYSSKGSNVTGSKMLAKPSIKQEIARLSEKQEQKAIMDSQELMELYSKIARGEVKDQFGLDASLNDRIKAMNELAKRTIDIENKLKGLGDNQITVKIDWKRD